MEPLIVEVALTELASKSANPNVPYSLEDIVADAVACAKAGAAIVHFHARDPVSGEQRWFDTDFYREAFLRIRAQCDAILYPTQPGSGMDRCPHVLQLAKEGVLEHCTVDIMAEHPAALSGDKVDPNVEVMKALNARNVAFSIGVRDVGHMRKIRGYREAGLLKGPLQLKIFFNEDPIGPWPDARGILAYLDQLAPGEACYWFTTLYKGKPDGRTFRELSMLAAAMGGHIRTGLGDNPKIDGLGTKTNVEMVRMAVELAHAAGRRVATAAEARTVLLRPGA
jgi:3-keto-5-aminohexanoate cleavage enzyme